MKKFLFLLFPILLSGCVSNTDEPTFHSTSIFYSSEVNYDYSEISHLRIEWSEIFSLEVDQYYVYFFSKTCSHCTSIKNQIIKYALRNDNFFFIEDNEQIVFKNDISYTIGLTSAENLAILGFPSLLQISSKKLIKNIAGTDKITSELKIYI